MSTSEAIRSLVYLAVVAALMQGGAGAQQTIWVDANEGSDFLGDGSSEDPYRTISLAAEEANSEGGNRIIRVIEGDYTQAHELSGLAMNPGYPIVITKPNIVIQGDDTDPAHYPRLGGDVAAVEESSAVEAIVQIVVPEGDDLSGIVLSRLRFVGEDTEELDAPSAIHVYCDVNQELTSSGAIHCIFERPEMNLGDEDGRPTVLVESPESGTVMQFTLLNCQIWCSNRGGAEVRIATETDEEDEASPVLIVEESQVLIDGDDDARFGLAYTNEEDASGSVPSGLQAWRVVVDSTGANEDHGIATGIAFLMSSTDEESIRPQATRIEACEVKGCLSDAVLIFGEEDAGNVNIVLSLENFRLNRLHHNGGAGIHVDWADDTAYLSVNSQNNLIYRNQYGIWYEGVNEDLGGSCSHKFETISKNTSYAFRMDGSGAPATVEPGPLLNSIIVWDNNGGGGNAQYGGTLSWNPQVEGQMFRSCWQNLVSPTNRNTNANPQLANTATDDYHLTSASTACIDLGDNLTGLSPTDLDLEDRTVNGNGQDGAEVDMGSDEYDP